LGEVELEKMRLRWGKGGGRIWIDEWIEKYASN